MGGFFIEICGFLKGVAQYFPNSEKSTIVNFEFYT
jgi:hypothetical protein